MSTLLLTGAAGGVALLILTARRPALACALLALAIPLTAGMARGAVVPLLRVNEALLLVVAAGLLVHHLFRWRAQAYRGLDLVVLGFSAVNVVVPWAVILLSGADAALDDWLLVLAPIQYLVVYLVYSRTEFTPADLRLFFNVCMLASIPVAAVAAAEALNIGGVRDLLAGYYPKAPQPSWDRVYRPASLLGHYSAVGAFGLLNLLLALALAATRQPGFPRWWLSLVVGANLLSMVASETYAPLAVLPVGAVAVLLVVRRVPWSALAAGLPVLGAAAVALWPSVSGRVGAQFGGAGGGIALPETMQTRIDYWQAFFIPALLNHGPWLGTGTLIPAEVPHSLVDFVDNGYLWELFRAGVPGLAMLVVMLVAVAAAAWATRISEDPSIRVLGAVCLGGVVSVVLLDTTSEYLTFTGVSQEFWMFTGLLSGAVVAARSAAAAPGARRSTAPAARGVRPGPLPVGGRIRVNELPGAVHANGALAAELVPVVRIDRQAGRPPGLRAVLGRLGPEGMLVRASAAVLAGFGLARAFGFLFQVVAGRELSPVGYGRLTYALAVANVAAVLLTTAPLGLSRFLSRSGDNRAEQGAYFVNWLAVVGLVLGASAVGTAVFAGPAGLGGWLLVGLLANLLGVAALETYREVQRGLGGYTLQSVFYVLANAVQLAVVLFASWHGWRSPEVFLIVYGLSSVAALVLVAPVSRGPRVALRELRWRRMARILGFMRPVLLQAIFWNVWFNADLILLLHLRGAAETGTYAAAKTIANGLLLVPTAVAFVFAPRVAQLAEAEVRGHLVRVLALTAAVSLPMAIGVAAVARPLTGDVFGGRYAAAAVPLVVLLAGVVPYGLKSVLASLWLGLGHPVVETFSSAAGMTVTVATGLWLIPRAGGAGAAAAFSAGALAQLVVGGAVTAWAFGARSPRVRHLGDREILAEEPPSEVFEAEAPPTEAGQRTLMVAEELGATPDEGYVSFVRALHAQLSVHRPTVLHATRGRRWAGWGPLRLLDRVSRLVEAARLPQVRAARPATVVYLSRSSVTAVALARARLLRALCRAPLAFVALQGSAGRRLPGFVLRRLAPDLLLVPTEHDRAAAVALGIPAATVCSGVDLERFRPPEPGEREALRRKWGLSPEDQVVLHVGHLRKGRNLRVMASIAAWPGVTALVAASSWRGPESDGLRRELEAHGVTVIDGYVPNVEELYRLADCYVFPTVSPGSAVALPLSILEALASDLPVVSTTFGALAERFGDVPGLELVESPTLLLERALAACGMRVRTRHLVQPYGWDALAGRLADLLDDLGLDRGAGGARGAPRRAVIAARLRRMVVDRRDLPRRFLWGRRPAYVSRPTSKPAIQAVAAPAALPRFPSPRADEVGIIGPAGSSPLAAAAGFLGLPVEPADRPAVSRLVDRALAERWPLIATAADAARGLPASLAAFVGRGGTLYLDALDQGSNPALLELGTALGVALPEVRSAPAARQLLFPQEQSGFARELAGTRLATACGELALQPVAEADVLAWSLAGGERQAAVAQRRVGEGRVVLSVLRRPAGDRLAAAMESDRAAGVVVPLLLLRGSYGDAAWRAPVVMANFTIDDPALRRGSLGLRYDLLAAQARDHGFHVTVATVPCELPLADDAVVRRLRHQPELLSACYHGCDHDGYEFYVSGGARTRHSPRRLKDQRAALRRAVDHGRRFANARAVELDRVMVFPYGVGPASLLGDLQRLGFLASCNFGDRYPLGAPVPARPDLGLRPADLAWEGFPLLWRRRLRDDGYLVDLLLGRPVLVFAHPRALGRDFAVLAERAGLINRASHGTAVWRSLDEVARHSYLQRHAPGSGWQVLMTANEACLHNPDPDPRTYAVIRPDLPSGSVFHVDGQARGGDGPLAVTVPPRGTAVVRLVPGGTVPELPGRRRCTAFGPVAKPGRLEATSE
ncbi:MAG TPA: glycosyltransferase, partial [Candidatus Dormibacteraeota bacterium]|nr:glycosyltransferase [Candidatus Dormibacteraeota bacterium]